LPSDLLTPGAAIGGREGHGFHCVRCGAERVGTHVRDPRSLSGRPSGGSGGGLLRDTRSTARDEAALDLSGSGEFSSRECSRTLDGITDAVVGEYISFEHREHTFCTVSGPRRDEAAVDLGQGLRRKRSCHPSIVEFKILCGLLLARSGFEMENPQLLHMNTAKVGRAAGYSTQQVRDLERLRIIPAAERSLNGYRRYEQRHLTALLAYKAMADAIGPVSARRVMPELIGGTVDDAAEVIDNLHAALSRDRTLLREALRGLDSVLRESGEVFEHRDMLTIGELAQALGVRPSALRHWEHEELVQPDRSAVSGARRYGAAAVAEARIVAALRLGGYRIPPIRQILQHLREHGLTSEARQILNDRLAELTRRSVSLLAASSQLHSLLAAANR